MKIVAVYGSPRRNGNTSHLLDEAVRGAEEAGAEVARIVLRDLRMSPCLEIYGCRKTGRCVIQDDFQMVHDLIDSMDGIILASPIFFYTVSALTKVLMDRCQSHWVKRYWIDETPFGKKPYGRKGLFISAGATHGAKLFDGVQLTVRYFFDAIDTELWKSCLYRGLDFEGDVLKHPEYGVECRSAGYELVRALAGGAEPTR